MLLCQDQRSPHSSHPSLLTPAAQAVAWQLQEGAAGTRSLLAAAEGNQVARAVGTEVAVRNRSHTAEDTGFAAVELVHHIRQIHHASSGPALTFADTLMPLLGQHQGPRDLHRGAAVKLVAWGCGRCQLTREQRCSRLDTLA